ncbi:hypothetical protein KYN89_08405 [Alteriqipengyuania sp. NZ-12B]|uniref:Uncharacterized protein n=2 Tax=Alteriqipengyuania abyssalis TaxID=2860200 RepID=A0ABS7PDC9_9SPHN|nr:hypothetical protein [Alteriqipengyuania abyssalis]
MLAALAVASTPALAERQTGQERLDKLLEGRVAGEPTNCVPHRPSARLYIIDKTAVVYDTGSTIYVNYTQDPEALDDDDYLVVRDPSPSLCRTTQITTRDRTGNFFSGAVFLTDFIPYKRVKDEG